ncbi:GNAT family N-acetyltransferase [Streptacidiphilus pinicola]|uniref:GNAT family N-acetyltransferase n=1 Tax=Streptacidiphilus pinicola TaxID=2219663 RepID=A0A2X0JVV9_9ACTN|nr:N-acetyltransferase [Streptacidiphilus pinicola]RAG81055.1 GNAT family N-acetyltransferase [Streptacidiphilus pinicola]
MAEMISAQGADQPYRPNEAAGTAGGSASLAWTVRSEAPDGSEITAVRRVINAAFPTANEADLVEALRQDRDAWLPGLSVVATAPDGEVVGHALLTRCHVDGSPALALAPVAVLPAWQRHGVGTAMIHALLDAAQAADEQLVLVLGHPAYYPRFGFVPASGYGIKPPFEVPDEAMLALALDPGRPVPAGSIRYAPAFGD